MKSGGKSKKRSRRKQRKTRAKRGGVRPEGAVVGTRYQITLNDTANDTVFRRGPGTIPPRSRAHRIRLRQRRIARGRVHTGILIQDHVGSLHFHLDGYPKGTSDEDYFFIPYNEIADLDIIEDFESYKKLQRIL